MDIRNTGNFLLGAVLTCMLLLGCAKHGTRTATFGSKDDLLSYGVYSAQSPDPAGLAVKLSLSQSGAYSKRKFQGACMLVENKGEWKCDNEAIEFHLQEIRKRADCSTEEWQTEKTDKTTRRELRNVTVNSFEVLDQEEQVSAEWVKFVKK